MFLCRKNMCWLSYALALPVGFVVLFKFLKSYFPWIINDFQYIFLLGKTVKQRQDLQKHDVRVPDLLKSQAEKYPNKKYIIFEDQSWTYQQINDWATKCAYALNSIGINPGDKIGLMMHNEPAFVATWFGSARLGSVAAFLNTNLRRKALLHCIKVAEIKLLIVGQDESLLEAVKQIEDELRTNNISLYTYGKETDLCWSFSSLVEKQKKTDFPSEWRKAKSYSDNICYIYTSGTTGLPKAVNINNAKAWGGALLFCVSKVEPDDVVYTSLPLYHSAASLMGMMGTMFAGCTVVLRKKFSASQLWPDCRKHDVTIIQYIGETMRYVCKQPVTSLDRSHKVRRIIGNGMRPDVWRTFLDRYGEHIHVCEFYAATEGNTALINLFNKFGSIGPFSPLYQKLSNAALVKYDMEKDEMIKDKNGRAIYCGVNEPGLLVAKIKKGFEISSYKGSKSLTDKKLLKGVFKENDVYFNSGDLLSFDETYHVHFCDRVGDTFRWKGENVSTNEVSDTVVQAAGIKEANVYGVEIPGHEGRAGMAALVLDGAEFDAKALYDYVCENLPFYARPVFARVTRQLELTGTLKQSKVQLRNEGYRPDSTGNDPVYFLDNNRKTYTRLSQSEMERIEEGIIKV